MVTIDRDGFHKIFPGKTPYQEYYMRNPNLELANMQAPAIKNADGSWRNQEGDTRWEIFSQPYNWWRYTEMTYVARVNINYSTIYNKMYNPEDENNWDFILQSYGRGGHHSQNDKFTTDKLRCDGSALKFALLATGKVSARKEINHPAYCLDRAITFAVSNPVGKILGHKTIIYNIAESGKIYTVQEYWMCFNPVVKVGYVYLANPAQVWKRLFKYIDRGGWSVQPERINNGDFRSVCPPLDWNSTKQYRQIGEILSKWGSNAAHGQPYRNLMALRSDQTQFDLWFLSVRDIAV